jgi:hypothetical protein
MQPQIPDGELATAYVGDVSDTWGVYCETVDVPVLVGRAYVSAAGGLDTATGVYVAGGTVRT